MLATQCPGLCWSLETFFLVNKKFNRCWGMFILLQNFAEPWVLERSRVMTDHVSFEWAFTSYNQEFSCKQFGEFFSRHMRDVRSSSLSTSIFEFIYWWLTLIFIDTWLCVVLSECGLYELQPCLFSCKQLGDFFLTDEGPAHKTVLTVFKLNLILLSDDWSRFSWISFYKLQIGL